ncbi:hypothetical protein HID58_034001 [Brassica napus]|uniref:Uncharacterized protein n=1 Tax=Brassica napus TaxID=3708 RepID=A0ABQ8C0T6_BRANA|nr:hypothetical protein HID58_034001 [Brassica napus]
MKSGRAIVKPPIEVMVISPDTNQFINQGRGPESETKRPGSCA